MQLPLFTKQTQGEKLNDQIKKLSANTVKWAVKNLKDIYKDDWDYIIQRELDQQFILDTYKDLCLLTTKELNLEKRVINEISNVYMSPAERRVVTGENKEGDKTIEVTDDRYEEVLKETQIDVVAKIWNRYTNLTNNILVRPIWREGKMEYDIHTFDNAEILTDDEDWKKFIAVKYYVGLELPFYDNYVDTTSGASTQFDDYRLPYGARNQYIEDYKYSYLWTLEDKDKNTGQYRKSYVYKFEKRTKNPLQRNYIEEELIDVQENPYKDKDGNPILPFILFSKTYPIDRLLDFSTGSDLVDITINTAINIVHLNALIKYSAWKQKWIATNDPETIPKDIGLAVQRIAVLPKSTDKSLEVGIWDQESDLNRYLETIMMRVKIVLAQYGLDVESFLRSGSPESGYKLKVRKEGLMELRKDQIELYRDYERKVFDITRIVNNWHSNAKIAENAEFKIDFADPKFETDASTENANWTVRINNNVKTPIDWIMADNPDLTEEEAKALYQKNKAINSENIGNIPLKPLVRNNGQGKINDKKNQQQTLPTR